MCIDLSGAGDTPISRRKSFKKSLRESFRRLRKGRSQRRTNTNSSPTRSTVIEKKKEMFVLSFYLVYLQKKLVIPFFLSLILSYN